MTKVICCKSCPSRWRIGRRSFSRSFNARALRVSAKEISRRCSKPSSANKPREGIYRVKREFTPHLNPLPSEGRGEQHTCAPRSHRRQAEWAAFPLRKRRGEGAECAGITSKEDTTLT